LRSLMILVKCLKLLRVLRLAGFGMVGTIGVPRLFLLYARLYHVGSLGSICKFGQLRDGGVGVTQVDTVCLAYSTQKFLSIFLKIPHGGGPPAYGDSYSLLTAPTR